MSMLQRFKIVSPAVRVKNVGDQTSGKIIPWFGNSRTTVYKNDQEGTIVGTICPAENAIFSLIKFKRRHKVTTAARHLGEFIVIKEYTQHIHIKNATLLIFIV